MSEIRAAILDFDGVLAESNAEKDMAFEELFAHYPEHSAGMRTYHLQNHAEPRRVKFDYYVEHLMQRGHDREMIDRMGVEFSRLVVGRVIRCPEVPGTSAFLQEFSQLIPLYISSVTPHEELGEIITERKITPHIKQAFGNPPYPKLEVVRRILALENLDPCEVVFVGDSESDYQVALQAKLVFLGRDSGQPFSNADLSLSCDLNEVADRLRPLVKPRRPLLD